MNHLIRSYDNGPSPAYLTRTGTSATRPTLNYGARDAMEIWQVARAATAAPLYFKALRTNNPHDTQGLKYYFSDGGFGPANNPCLLGIQELERLHGEEGKDNTDVVGVVVSVGTAKADSLPGGVNFFVDTVKELTEAATSANTIADILENQKRSNKLKNYWRFNDLTGLRMELDEWEPNGWFTSRKERGSSTLEAMRNAFNHWALERTNDQAIRACAKELVARRRARTADASLWEQYATGAARFRCKHHRCKKSSYTFRHEFNAHFVEQHGNTSDALAYREPNYTRWQYPPKENT